MQDVLSADASPGDDIRPTANIPIAMQVRRILEHRVLTNALKPGALLSENDLSASLGVSRQPVREALIRLSELGLVRALPQRGTEVTRIDATAVSSGRFVREAVECATVREAARRARPADLERMRALITAQRASAQARDHVRFLALDDALHRTIAVAAGHEPAWCLLRAVKLQMDRVRYLSLEDATPLARLVAQHAAILKALRARDPDTAEAAMRAHLGEMLASLPALAARLPDFFEAN